MLQADSLYNHSLEPTGYRGDELTCGPNGSLVRYVEPTGNGSHADQLNREAHLRA